MAEVGDFAHRPASSPNAYGPVEPADVDPNLNMVDSNGTQPNVRPVQNASRAALGRLRDLGR